MPNSDRKWGMFRLAWVPILVFAISPFVAEAAYRWAGVSVQGNVQGVLSRIEGGPLWHRPNVDILQTWFSGNFWVRTDSVGFRAGQAGVGDPAPDILVVGDSQAFGQGVDYEDSVVGAFAELAASEGLSVANAAVGGHWLRDQAALARWLARERGVRPRAVLVCLTPRAVARPEAGGEYDHVSTAPPTSPGFTARALGWLSRNSAVYLVVRNAFRGREAAERSWKELEAMYRTDEVSGAKVSQLADRLARLAGVVETTETPLVACYMPLEAGFRIETIAAGQGGRAVDVNGDVPLELASAAAAASGVPLVDLTPVLLARRSRGADITLRGDAHYNAETSRECAAALWREVDWVGISREDR